MFTLLRAANWRQLSGYPATLAAITLTSVSVGLINRWEHVPNVSLLYLPMILVAAVYFGTGPSLTAATLAVLEFDFFFVPPIHRFTIARAEDILAFGIFFTVAVLTSQLAVRARERAEAAQQRALESSTLYELGQALMSAHDVPQILQAITGRIVGVFAVDHCAIFVPDTEGRPVLAAESPEGIARDRAGEATAAWVLRRGTQVWLPVGAAETLHNQRTYVPLRTADRTVGVMEVGAKQGQPLDDSERKLVVSFAAQAALVIAQAQNAEAQHRLQVVEESDRLKSALLNAVSHDLRTPLSSIKASATALLLTDSRWAEEEGREFLQTIDFEADRLNRLVGNLLDLSRIEGGILRPILDWYHPQEVIDEAMPHIRSLLGTREFTLEMARELPPIQVDLLRMSEVLTNLIDNAVKYSPRETPIELRIWQHERGVSLAVIDHGPGVPIGIRSRIFDAFYQGRRHGDSQRGTGLGLAICRGVAQAHGGTIRLEGTTGGGATFVFTLPPVRVGQVPQV